MSKTTRIIVVSVFCFGLLLFSGCAPRGETKTLEEVFTIAKQRYEKSIVDSKASAPTKEKLILIVSQLKTFVEAPSPVQARSAAQQISTGLAELIPTAGYTTRPALNELTMAYRAFSAPGDGGEDVEVASSNSNDGEKYTLDASAKKLLVARSYTALAQELETTSFHVEKAGV